MSAHVLLNLLKELGQKRSNARLCLVLYLFFHNKFNKFIYTGAWI